MNINIQFVIEFYIFIMFIKLDTYKKHIDAKYKINNNPII